MIVEDVKARSTYQVQVLDRAVQLLDVLAKADHELGVSELSERLHLHKSTVHRLLATMERHRLVEKNRANAKYNLGWHLFELGSLTTGRMELHKFARVHLEDLVNRTRETAHLGVLRECDVISILNVETRCTVRTPGTIGQRTPAHCTSQGKAILANMSETRAAEILDKLKFEVFTPNTLRSIRALKAELKTVRERGYAIDDEEFEIGLRCIGAPVRNHSGEVIAAISIAGPAYRVGGEALPELIKHVVETSHNLSAALGGRRK